MLGELVYTEVDMTMSLLSGSSKTSPVITCHAHPGRHMDKAKHC